MAVSKLKFNMIFANKSCHDLIHPWHESCLKGNLMLLVATIKGSTKFFALMYAAQYAIKYKTLSKNDIPFIAKNFLRSLAAASTYATLFTGMNCISRKCFGYFDYNSLGYWIPFISGFGLCLDHSVRRALVSPTFTAMAIESVLKKYYQTINVRSKNLETLCFMVCNAILMYWIRVQQTVEQKTRAMWFFTPPRIMGSHNDSTACPHNESCKAYQAKDTAKYFSIGLALPFIKEITTNPQLLKRPVDLIRTRLQWKNLRLALFAASYVIIYKAMSCYLCTKNKKDSIKYGLICGFVSGISYRINPNLTILSSMLMILLYKTGRELKETMNLPDLPYKEILCLMSNMYLLKIRVLDADSCSPSFIRIIDFITQNKSGKLYDAFKKQLDNKVLPSIIIN